jgi:hypothetical protein
MPPNVPFPKWIKHNWMDVPFVSMNHVPRGNEEMLVLAEAVAVVVVAVALMPPAVPKSNSMWVI